MVDGWCQPANGAQGQVVGAPVSPGVRPGAFLASLGATSALRAARGGRGTTLNVVELSDQERALREDIRLVGRVLGETIKQQQGEAVFSTIERIRQVSIAFRRNGDAAARRELEGMLDSLSHDRTIEVVR